MKKCLSFLALLVLAAPAFAQVNVTSVSGVVNDQTGAAVPGVSVQVVNPSTGETISVLTSDKGQYVVPSLGAATYRVTFSKPGFKTQTVQNVALIVGVPGTLNVKLEVGAAAESVEVTAGAEVVQATTADVSSNLTGKQLTDLPFATRNAIELTVDLPGTSTPGNPRSSSINGLPKGALNITIDGMNTQDNMLKSSDGFFSYIMPSVDAMEEVTVETSAAGVDSSAQGGAQIKFVTRSGTNNWHGGGFWQGRNTWFNANYYYNNQVGLPRDTIRLNQEGGHIGGPIRKNKLFFFGNAEFYRFPGTNQYKRNYLTPTASSGIFSYVNSSKQVQQVNLLNLARAANASLPAGSTPYPTAADPTLAKTYALMQQAGALGAVTNNQSSGDYNTLTTSYLPSGIDARDFFTTRIDYLVNSKNTLSIIYNYDWYNSVPDLLNGVVPDFPGTGTVLFSNVSTGQASNRFDGTISLRSTINPRMTNEYRMGLNGGTVLFFPDVAPGMFGVWRGYVPSFASPGTGLSGVTTTSGPQRRNAPVKNIGDTVTWVKGSHQLSFGGNWDQINLYQEIEGNALFPGISFGISPNDPITTGATNIFNTTNFPGATTAQLSQAANLYADVVGRVSGISQGLVLSEQTHAYTNASRIDRDQLREFGLFVSDQWRVKPTLTVNLGLRVEKQG
ncbi:MAG TPA: carboxypeptidase-like regulatory domain-containing protein, partial [Verrucomicrobiae bacterium]|nr:carboxypeptidase-like regulatory domain-containing protein [Verrucomicrobiae bacterium]